MTSLKIKGCGIVNRHNYIFIKQPQFHKFNFEIINYCSNNILLYIFPSFVIASKYVIETCQYFPISQMRNLSREILMNSKTYISGYFQTCV